MHFSAIVDLRRRTSLVDMCWGWIPRGVGKALVHACCLVIAKVRLRAANGKALPAKVSMHEFEEASKFGGRAEGDETVPRGTMAASGCQGYGLELALETRERVERGVGPRNPRTAPISIRQGDRGTWSGGGSSGCLFVCRLGVALTPEGMCMAAMICDGREVKHMLPGCGDS